jgi:hypothetical protein
MACESLFGAMTGSGRSPPSSLRRARLSEQTQSVAQALTSRHNGRGVFPRRRFGRYIPLFDCYLRAQTGPLARGHDSQSAVRDFHPGQDHI